jgi:hypothetical protein
VTEREQQMLKAMCDGIDRVEAKLDKLLEALATEDDDKPTHTLDGDVLPADRAEHQEL